MLRYFHAPCDRPFPHTKYKLGRTAEAYCFVCQHLLHFPKSLEVVICHSMPDLSLWIRVLLKFSHTSSPGWLCLWIVTPQHVPCLHMVLSNVITVEIPEVSACVYHLSYFYKLLVMIDICPHFLLFLWLFYRESERWKTDELRELPLLSLSLS